MGTQWAQNLNRKTDGYWKQPLNWAFPVVGTGVDPVTSRFSGARAWREATKHDRETTSSVRAPPIAESR